jgi:hypothetical protein
VEAQQALRVAGSRSSECVRNGLQARLGHPEVAVELDARDRQVRRSFRVSQRGYCGVRRQQVSQHRHKGGEAEVSVPAHDELQVRTQGRDHLLCLRGQQGQARGLDPTGRLRDRRQRLLPPAQGRGPHPARRRFTRHAQRGSLRRPQPEPVDHGIVGQEGSQAPLERLLREGIVRRATQLKAQLHAQAPSLRVGQSLPQAVLRRGDGRAAIGHFGGRGAEGVPGEEFARAGQKALRGQGLVKPRAAERVHRRIPSGHALPFEGSQGSVDGRADHERVHAERRQPINVSPVVFEAPGGRAGEVRVLEERPPQGQSGRVGPVEPRQFVQAQLPGALGHRVAAQVEPEAELVQERVDAVLHRLGGLPRHDDEIAAGQAVQQEAVVPGRVKAEGPALAGLRQVARRAQDEPRRLCRHGARLHDGAQLARSRVEPPLQLGRRMPFDARRRFAQPDGRRRRRRATQQQRQYDYTQSAHDQFLHPQYKADSVADRPLLLKMRSFPA